MNHVSDQASSEGVQDLAKKKGEEPQARLNQYPGN